MDCPEVVITNKGVKLYLCIGNTDVGVTNPYNDGNFTTGYIDLVGLKNKSVGSSIDINGYEVAPAAILTDERGATRNLFANNTLLKSMQYAFSREEKAKIYNIPINVFSKLKSLQDITGIFIGSDLSETELNDLIFKKCVSLKNISHAFSRHENSTGTTGTSLQGQLPQNLFTKYDNNTGNGQNLVNVSNAFRGNKGLTGEPIKFWEIFTTIQDSSYCYAYCTNLTGYDDPTQIPGNYGGGIH